MKALIKKQVFKKIANFLIKSKAHVNELQVILLAVSLCLLGVTYSF